MQTSNLREADYLVSILNHIVEAAGYEVEACGFGFDGFGNISTINGDDLDDDLTDALEWVWNELLPGVIINNKNKAL